MENSRHTPTWLILAILALVDPAFAQFGSGNGDYAGYGGFNDGDGDGDGGFFGSSSAASNIYKAEGQRAIHGILAAVAFVILFPLGAVSMTTLSGRYAFRIHVMTQVIASLLFLVAAVFGFIIVRGVNIPGADGRQSLLTNSYANYHPILGILIFVLVILQPILGILHHRQFKLTQRRVLVSHLHLWNGRLVIILGIVNGGLGLRISNASTDVKTKYAIVAGVLGGLWLLASLLGEGRRARRRGVFGRWRAKRRAKREAGGSAAEARLRRKATGASEEQESETGSVGR
ncbi:hypothetical protein BD289DRAFT_93294 [Coniella lustricola]|uniref:Cytochrome b561 domain-containing protein n=1 Tax=Coniella lustricola TaxID=2025994 RepID=A0A2T2ZYD2_9PEZI|nr:hypothetical protein BD289DRAFT_93294 [Coniella lustricola]